MDSYAPDSDLHYLDEVVLLSSAGVSSRLKDPRSALAGARAGLLLLSKLEAEEEERKLDSTHAQQRGKHWVCKTTKENLWRFLVFNKKILVMPILQKLLKKRKICFF